MFYTKETWANNSMSQTRTWNEERWRARLSVSFGNRDRTIIAHVGSRTSGLLDAAGSVFVGKNQTAAYPRKMCSDIWLKWLENQFLLIILGGILVVPRVPYHLVLTNDTRPANSSMRKAVLADWLTAHGVLPDDCAGDNWRRGQTSAQVLSAARQKPTTPRCPVQDLVRQFDVVILISPVAHPELIPIELVWATLQGVPRRENADFSMSRLKELVDQEFKHTTAEA